MDRNAISGTPQSKGQSPKHPKVPDILETRGDFHSRYITSTWIVVQELHFTSLITRACFLAEFVSWSFRGHKQGGCKHKFFILQKHVLLLEKLFHCPHLHFYLLSYWSKLFHQASVLFNLFFFCFCFCFFFMTFIFFININILKMNKRYSFC